MKYEFGYTLGNLPLIEIKIVKGDRVLTVDALIDTGADYTIFPRDIADELEIDIKRGELIVLEGAGLGKIVAYKHAIQIIIENTEINSEACFSIENDLPENLLGRMDLLTSFRIVFEKDKFSLESL